MSRRLRDQRTLDDLHCLLSVLRLHPVAGTLIVDGKPLAVSKYTHDPEARCGWGAGRYALGYKLHVLIDTAQQLLAWDVQPMNEAESVVARHLLAQAAQHQAIAANAVLLGDAAYDSNPLHATAQQLGVQLIAPRRKPNRSISSTHRQHPSRLLSIKLTEHDHARAKQLKDQRIVVERYLGTLATVGGGLIALPAWARRLARVRVWVGAKLAIHAARSALKQATSQTLAA